MIRFQCACGKAYQLKDEMGGKKVKCPACQAVMAVPVPAVLSEIPAPTAAALAPAPLAPLGGLSPLPGNDLFAGLPTGALGQTPLGVSPLGMPNAGFAPPSPLAGPAARPAGSPTSPLVWIIGGISGAVVLAAVVVGVLLVIVLSGNNNRPRGYIPPEPPRAGTPPVAGAPGAPGGGVPLPAHSLSDQIKQPTVTKDWRGRATVGSQIGQWQLYASDDGGYQINLPGKPQVVPQSLNSPAGPIKGSTAIVGSDASGLVIVITHVDVPYDATVVPVDKLAETQISLQGGRVLRTKDVQISGKPGKEFLADINKAGFSGRAVFRTLGLGGRVFTLAYLGQNGKFDEANAAECLDSFMLLKEPPPPPSSGDQPFNGGIPIVRDFSWTKQESAAFRFRVELPAAGKRMESNPQQQASKETWACEVAGKGAFVVNATSLPIPIPQGALAGSMPLLKQELARTFGQPASETGTQQGEAYVVDFVFNQPVGMRTLVRGYLTSKVAYQLTWSGPPELASSEEVNRFFNSFAITPEAGATNPASGGQPEK